MNYFEESKIFAGKNIAIFKALLFFNLPHDLIFNRNIRPKLNYSYPHEDHKNELKDMIEDEEERMKQGLTNSDGKPQKTNS